MSDFWSSDLGEITGKSDDAFAKSFMIIPDGTMSLAKIESFINSEYQGEKYLSIDWMITGGDFKGRKVNQKLKVFGDKNDKARHRALNMLKLMYQLYSLKPAHPGAPNDQDLLVFVGKEAGIKIRETEPKIVDGKEKSYNWVAEIHEAKGFKCETGVKLVVSTSSFTTGDLFDSALSRNQVNSVSEDDLPF